MGGRPRACAEGCVCAFHCQHRGTWDFYDYKAPFRINLFRLIITAKHTRLHNNMQGGCSICYHYGISYCCNSDRVVQYRSRALICADLSHSLRTKTSLCIQYVITARGDRCDCRRLLSVTFPHYRLHSN